ncbi:MAG: ABC transporter permease [Myxococcota bacterium]
MSQPTRVIFAMRRARRKTRYAPGYVCRPGSKSIGAALRELWEFRNLLRVFVWRDVRLRYRNTALGAGWNLLQPLGYLAVFSLVFGFVGGTAVPEAAVPYPLFLYPGLLVWQLLSRILSLGGSSIDSFKPLLSRVFFPRMIAPLTAVTGALVDFGVATPALVLLMVGYSAWPGWPLLTAPLFVALTVVLGLGIALWLTALDATYRDIRHALAFLTQIWLFASPVVYPLSRVPPALRALYSLNPMVGILEGFRFALVPGAPAPSGATLCASAGLALGLLVTGLIYFNAREGTLVDDG